MSLQPHLCVMCGSKSEVVDTRPLPSTIRRRRVCTSCGERWTTYELVIPDDQRVVITRQAGKPTQVATLEPVTFWREVEVGSADDD